MKHYFSKLLNKNTNLNKLREGGNAVNGVSRIPQKYVKPTIDMFIKNVLDNLDYDEWAIIGSTGKKPEGNGDIDLGVQTFWSIDELSKGLTDLGLECSSNKGLGEVSCKFPQFDENSQEIPDTYVQVDLIIGAILVKVYVLCRGSF